MGIATALPHHLKKLKIMLVNADGHIVKSAIKNADDSFYKLQQYCLADFLEQTDIDWDADVTEKEKKKIVFADRNLLVLYHMYLMTQYYGALTNTKFSKAMKQFIKSN